MTTTRPDSVGAAQAPSPDAERSALLHAHIAEAIAGDGGWIGFDRFMALALYTPHLGYYTSDSAKFGALPSSGSDFVTAPEMTPLFGEALSVQVGQALAASGTDEVWEFGAGSGALAQQLLESLGDRVKRYTIVDLSGNLRARQQARLAAWGDTVRWVAELPERIEGVVVGNEVLDAMPVKLLARTGGAWSERGVVLHEGAFAWGDMPTDLRPPMEVEGEHDYLTEIHPQGQAFVRTLGDRLARGAALLIDYGFGEREYYHPQRHMGTVMCHWGHRSDSDPLANVGLKDITAHVDFTNIAVAAQEAGLDVLGYTTQARLLLNCGLAERMAQGTAAERTAGARLVHEHEMGELFKALLLAPAGAEWLPLGFAQGDRSHTL